MKSKIVMCVLLLNIYLIGFSQPNSYTITTFSEVYADIENPVSLNNGEVWENPEYTIPLGFDFLFFDQYIDTLYFFFEGAGCILSDLNQEGGNHKLIIPFGSSLLDRGYESGISQSPLSYSISGVEGGKIAKIEWKNAGFYGEYDVYATQNDYVNFQLWLYEAEGKIEVRFGSRSIAHPEVAFVENGPAVSLIPAYDYWFDMISPLSVWLINDPYGPEIINSADFQFLDFMPPLNYIYQFTNLVSSTVTIEAEQIVIYPNPVKDYMYFRDTEKSGTFAITSIATAGKHMIHIYNTAGTKMLEKEIYLNERINIESLPSGLYYISLIGDNGEVRSFKVCKI